MIEDMLAGYIACALWSSNDESDPETGGDPMDDNYSPEDIHPDTVAAMRADCEAFIAANAAFIEAGPGDASQAGHDFWLTRNGHGTGFWDRSDDVWPEAARNAMDAFARKASDRDLYIGDDNMVHQ